MAGQTSIEHEYNDSLKAHEEMAASTISHAFNEGFLLGRRYAESLYGENDNENKS